MIKIILTSFLLLSNLFSVESNIATISSPDKSLELKLNSRDGSIYYSLNKNNITIINDSKLGIIADKFNLSDNMSITSIDFNSKNETWNQVWGEQKVIADNYNEVSVSSVSKVEKYNIVLRFRLFNDGLGFRYEIGGDWGVYKYNFFDSAIKFDFYNYDLRADYLFELLSWNVHFFGFNFRQLFYINNIF